MKRLILFAAIFCGLAVITRAQTTEKVKTKIEGPGFKKKIKTEGDVKTTLMSTSAHPAYVHRTAATKHHYTGTKTHTGAIHAARANRGHTQVTRHNTANVGHYKKIKRKHENGEYKLKYKK